MSIEVIVADDHEVVRIGIAEALRDSGISIVEEARDGLETIEKTRRLRPDVLILDVVMPTRDGLFALEELRRMMPQLKVIVHSMYDNPTYVARSIALGANDYILKSQPLSELVEAIRRVVADGSVAASPLVEEVRKQLEERDSSSSIPVPLTSRELQVLRHLAFGMSNREIGLSLEISVETVKEHVQNILRKIDASDRTQAAVWGLRNQLI